MRTALKGDVIVISMKLRKNGIFEFRSLWMMCSKVCEQFSAASKEAIVSVPIVMLTCRILYMNPVISQSSWVNKNVYTLFDFGNTLSVSLTNIANSGQLWVLTI